MTKIVSIDPGAMKLGLAVWENGRIKKTGEVSLVSDSRFGDFKKKNQGNYQLQLVDNLLNFMQNSADFKGDFLDANFLIIEDQGIRFTHALSFAAASFVRIRNPLCEIYFFSPMTMSRFFKIGGLTRSSRKAKIREIVSEMDPEISKDGGFSQDEIDACLNIFYFLKRKKCPTRKTPYYRCGSLHLTRSRT